MIIGLPEILYITAIISGFVVYLICRDKAKLKPSQNAYPQFSLTQSNNSDSRTVKKLLKKQKTADERINDITSQLGKTTSKVQDLEVALKLKPEKKEEKKHAN